MATNSGIPIKELQDNPIALREFSRCLDRVFKSIPYWSHLAFVLNIDNSVIRQCELYLEESPTIKLFEYLQATKKQELTIKDLKDALKAIQRVDIYIKMKRFKDEDKVSEVITDPSSDIMDEIAQELDSARKPSGNWEKLAQNLGVPHDIYQRFAMYNDYNPTVALVRYLYATSKEPILLKDFMDCFDKMGRKDVLNKVKQIIKVEDMKDLNASEVLKVGSDDLQAIAVLLNKDIQGVQGWRQLGNYYFKVDSSIMDDLEPPKDKEVHSPTAKIISWLTTAVPSTTIDDVTKALEKIKRYDALRILKSHFDIDDTANDAKRKSTTPPDSSPEVPPKAPEMFGIQATEQSSTRIFQCDVLKFGLPSNSKHEIIGRETEKKELITNLTDKQIDMVVLHAIPGCGKTTLVVSVAHDIIEDPHRYTVVYVDSKHVFSLEDLAYKILTTCGITSSANRPIPQVIDLFSHSKQDCVLILENLDHMYHSKDTKKQASTTLTGSTSDHKSLFTFKKEEFQSFLKDVTKSAPQLKVLVTTWEPLQYLSIKVKQMTLNLFDREQSLELMKLRSEIPITDQPELVEPIIKCCGGIPLLLCAAVIFLSDSGSVEAACKHFAYYPLEKQLEFLCPDFLPDEERLNHCLGKCFERMKVCSREVLVLLSVFPNLFTLKEAQHIAKGSKIDELQLQEGFQSLRKFCFLNTYDVKSETYVLHPAIRSFGISKARQENKLEKVFEPARCRYIFYTFDILSEIEEEFFSTRSMHAIQNYRLQDENIREIARWCITDSRMDVNVKQFCIQSFIRSQFVLLKLMRSYLLKMILLEFAQISQKNGDKKLYCECQTLRGAKIVFGCLCTPYLCPTALEEANVCFCKVIKALVEDDGKGYQETGEKIYHVYGSNVISDKAKAQFLLKYGKCLVRLGYNEQGFDSIEKGIDVRGSKVLSDTKYRVMLAMGFEDLAGAYSTKREHVNAISIREKHVLPTFRKELGMHPFTATAHSQLARNYLELGDYAKAIEANEIALRYRKTLLGDHQDTARSVFDKGVILSQQAQAEADPSNTTSFFKEALSYLQEALEIQKRSLDTPEETALTYQELAFVLTQLGRRKEAEQQMHMITKCLEEKKTTQDNLPRFPKSTSQEEDVMGSTEIKREPITPIPNEGSSTGSDISAQVNKPWFTNAKEFIKEKLGLKSGDKIDDFFARYENFALDHKHEVPALDLEELIRVMKHSIGAIIATNDNDVKVYGATCFRIGTKYVITNRHVVDKIIGFGIKWSSCSVDFNYEEQGQPDYRVGFATNPVLVSSGELDYAILELYSNGVEGFPSSVTELGYNIAPSGRQLQDGEYLTFIGHPGVRRMQIDVSCPIKLERDIQKRLRDSPWNNYQLLCSIQKKYKNPDYAKYDVSTFFKGSSGSPGFLMEKKLLMVLHSGGFPFQGANQGYVLEYGPLMSSVVKDVMDKINNGTIQNVKLDDIFGDSTSSEANRQCLAEPMDIDQDQVPGL